MIVINWMIVINEAEAPPAAARPVEYFLYQKVHVDLTYRTELIWGDRQRRFPVRYPETYIGANCSGAAASDGLCYAIERVPGCCLTVCCVAVLLCLR